MHPYDPSDQPTIQQYQLPQDNASLPEQRKWYQTNGGIILFLILFFPLGLFLMWKYTAGWPKPAKWLVTAIFAFLLVMSSTVNAMTSPGNVTKQPRPTHLVTHISDPTARPAQTPTATPVPTSTPTVVRGQPTLTVVQPTPTVVQPTPTVVQPTPTPVEPQPTQPPAVVCNGGTVMGGVCYNTDANGGSVVFTTPPGFCDHYTCIANFNNGTGYIVECADQRWSHSGGNLGVCFFNGGVIATLYRH